MPSDKTQKAAQILVAARREGTVIDDLPAELRPGTLAESYQIQYEIARLFGAIGGWKVGLPKGDEAPRATPIPAEYVVPSGGSWPAAGPTRVEVELAVTLGASLPPRNEPYHTADVLGVIVSAHIAFELLGARFKERKLVAPLTLLADGQSNGGLVVGGEIADWTKLDLTTLKMTLEVDGAVADTASAGTSFDRTVDMLVWLANHAAEHVGGLRAGQTILTGARIGPTAIPAQRKIEAKCNGASVKVGLG